ncbi:hypothetical protein FACS189432_09560 [Bacteroidia bacterium]|nr:hypothetical protein FACS189432_09560 [Bacteroidia bacterium]
MGISNTDIALYTSWLYLPWVIKPFWSPFIDILKTKRWWIVLMQIFIGAGFAGIAFTIPLPFFFQATLAFFWLLAFSSATHDIAADGFYMLGLDTNQQAMYVGIRSTFYRIATIMGQGFLIILAGFLESSSGREPLLLSIEASPQYAQTVLQLPPVVGQEALEGDLHFVMDNETLQLGTQTLDKNTLKLFLDEITASNQDNGFVIKEQAIDKGSDKKESWWTAQVSQPFGNWIKTNFGEKREAALDSDKAGNVAVAAVKLSKKPESGKDIVLNTTQNKGDKSISIIQGERLVFNESNWNKPAYLVFQVDPKLSAATSAEYKGLSGNIPFAWSITFYMVSYFS